MYHHAHTHSGSIQLWSNAAQQPPACSYITGRRLGGNASNARKLDSHATPRPGIRSTRRFGVHFMFCAKIRKEEIWSRALLSHTPKCAERKRRRGVRPSSLKPQNTVTERRDAGSIAVASTQFVAVASTHNPTHILPAVQQRTSPARKQPAKSPSQFVEDKGPTARGGPRSCRRRYPRLTRCRGGSTPVSMLQNPPASR